MNIALDLRSTLFVPALEKQIRDAGCEVAPSLQVATVVVCDGLPEVILGHLRAGRTVIQLLKCGTDQPVTALARHLQYGNRLALLVTHEHFVRQGFGTIAACLAGLQPQ